MSNHSPPYFRIQSVTKDGNAQENDEQENIQAEYHHRYPVEPDPIVRKIMQENGDYTSAHGN